MTSWRGLPPTVRILVLARAVNRLGAFTLPFLTVTLVQECHASVGEAGCVLAAFGLATIPSRLLGGRLADRVGGRATIVVGLTGTAAAQLCIAGSRTLLQATAAVVLLGLVFEIYEPPSQAIIAEVTPVDLRPAAYGLLGAAMAAAGLAAGLLAALLSDLDLRYLFVADAATCLTCAWVVLVFLPRTPGAGRHGVAVASAWTDRRLLSMLATGTAFAVVYLQLTVALPLTLAERGHSASLIGVLLTLSALTMVLGQPVLTHCWVRSVDDFTAMVLGYATLGVGLLLNGLVTSAPGFLVATVIWSLGDLVLLGRAQAVVAWLAPASARGHYLAVYGVSWGIAGVVAPVLGTQLLTHGGPRLVWAATATLCAALAAAQPTVRRRCRMEHVRARQAARRPADEQAGHVDRR